MRCRMLMVTLFGLLSSCSDDSTETDTSTEIVINADDYDRSCMQASDCMVIFTGPVCSCDCNSSAINVSARDAYFDDRGSPECEQQCGACAGAVASCDGNTCEAIPTP
jgi:hypothetical protein